MSPLFLRRPLAAALAAVVLASGGAAYAATTAVPAVPAVPAMPDIEALVAEATEFAKRHTRENVLAALDVDLSGLPPSIAFFASEFGHPREIVKNAPYSAEAVTESIQLLPDGNRIVRKSSTLLARDGAGRTRQERKGDGRGGIFISDPMEGRNFVLNESSRTVTRIPRMPSVPMPPTPPTPATPPAPPSPPAAAVPPAGGGASRDVEVLPGKVVVRRKSSSGDNAGGAEDVHVEVIRIGRGEHAVPFPPSPPMPPMTLPMLPRGKGETKGLGTREFDGVKADGTLTTHTIPAGEIGNEKPILVTSERWFSPELHIVVYARTNDPRAGETIYRLANVKRSEPPADLFKVPADYRARGDGRKS